VIVKTNGLLIFSNNKISCIPQITRKYKNR